MSNDAIAPEEAVNICRAYSEIGEEEVISVMPRFH
jgi:hypothetical protein